MDLTRFADEYWERKDDRVDGARLDVLMAQVPAGSRVLVVDGGPGMLAARLVERGHEVVMTDLSQHAVGRAQAKGLTAHHLDTDDDPLPFDSHSFDCVISDSAIEHRYYPEKAVGECARVLRPGGTFVLLVPNIAHWRHRLWLLFGRFPEVIDGPSDRCHLRLFGASEAKGMVRNAGLKVTGIKGFDSLWVKGLYPKVFRAPGVRALYRGLTRLRPQFFGRDVILICRRPN